MTDWLEILRQQGDEGRTMEREVPKVLSDPALSSDQLKMLFDAMEKQAGFVEDLRKVLDRMGYEPDVVKAAEGLEDLYGELAAQVAERLRAQSA